MSQEYHSFKVELANMKDKTGKIVGIEKAIFLQDIAYWCDYNRSSDLNFREGEYWTYSTIDNFCKRHPYWTQKQLRRIISSCEESGLLITDNYNEDKRDRTKWYTVSDEVLKVLALEKAVAEAQMGSLECPNGQNTTAQMGKCIYNEENTEKNIQETYTGSIESIPDGIDRCTARQMQPVIDAWNALGLQQIKLGDSTTTRYKQLKARIKTYGLDGVLCAVEKIKTSAFLKGDNPRGWAITFDWFIKPNNFPKVLEGNYNQQRTERAQQPRKKSWSEIAQEMESEGWSI